jgi:hypothetical protein
VSETEASLPDVGELYHALERELTPTQWRTFKGTLAMFLSAELDKHLKNVAGCSKSTVSRLLGKLSKTALLEQHRYKFQVEALRSHAARVRRQKPWMVIRVDLTSVAKSAKCLPFLRTYNGVHGIHLIVVHVSIGKLSLPMAHAIYDPAKDETPIELALKLIKPFHPYSWGDLPQFLVMDAGFYSADALDLLRWWGFEHVSFGARGNLKLKDGRRVRDAKRAEAIELDSLPGVRLYVSWVSLPRQGAMRRFYVLDTKPGTARTLTTRHKRRWLIESFFKSAKHDFGLMETRLRTETGIHNWLFLVWLSISLALYQQFQAGMTHGDRPAWTLTLSEAAQQVMHRLMPEVIRLSCLALLARLDYLESQMRTRKCAMVG